MPYMDYFKSIVTLSKRNSRYYGPTESNKMRSNFTEISSDLGTVYNEIDSINESIDALASGYLLPSGSVNSLYDLKREVYLLEERLNQRIYIQAVQTQVLE